MKKIDDEKTISKILDKYNSGLSLANIAKEVGLSKPTITRIVDESGYKIPNRRRTKYYIDSNYFSKIDKEDKAYWLGFIAADGNIRKDLNRLRIELAIKDKKHLEKFANDINTNSPIVEVNREYPSCYININNHNICNDLVNKGIVPNKSLILDIKLDEIEEKYYYDIIRGYFDGDGSINYHIRNNSNKKEWRIEFVGTKDVLQKFSDIMVLNKAPTKKDNYYVLSIIKREQIMTFIKLCYNNPLTYLDRKYEKIKEALNDYQVAT